jgi:DNA-binding response OmpR family regulator
MYILIIDDNKELCFGLKKLLEDAKFQTYTAMTIKAASKMLNQRTYDLILLDWMLPDGDGVSFLEQQRQTYHDTTPVLLLSSKSDTVDKVKALDHGADDYLEKPFSNIELLARIRALLRRESKQKLTLIKIDMLEVNLATREVFVANQAVTLSKKEFELLELLLLHPNTILTRYQIHEHLNREFDSFRSSNVVDAHIKNLRKKLSSASILIETVRGVGFKIKKI